MDHDGGTGSGTWRPEEGWNDGPPGGNGGTARIAAAVACEVAQASSTWASPVPSTPSAAIAGVLRHVRAALEHHGGRVEDLPGDQGGIVAVFGPDAPSGDAVDRAVAAAVSVRRIAEAAVESPSLSVKTGIGACDVAEQNEAAARHSIQRAIDLAVRLERMARPGEVIVGEDAWQMVRSTVDAEPVDPNARLEGDEPVGPFRLLEVHAAVESAEAPAAPGREELAEAEDLETAEGHDEHEEPRQPEELPALEALAPEQREETAEPATEVAGDGEAEPSVEAEPPAEPSTPPGAAPGSPDEPPRPAWASVYRPPVAAPPDPPAPPRALASPPLVGRDTERTRLLEDFERVSAERGGSLVLVTGEAGIGKTALVEDVLAELGDPTPVLRVRCLSPEDGGAAWPVAELAEAATSVDPRTSPEEAQAALAALLEGAEATDRLTSRLGHWLALPGTEAASEETAWVLRGLLRAASRERPVVIFLDDAGHLDPAFLFQLRSAAAQGPEAAALVIATANRAPEAVPGEVLALGPLPNEELAHLAAGLLEASVDASVVAAVGRASGGNPLAAEHLLATLLAEGRVGTGSAGWIPIGDPGGWRLPTGLDAILDARLRTVPVEDRAALGLAAAMGERFAWAPLEELLPESLKADALERLERLAAARLLRVEPTDRHGPVFGFRHASLRDAALRTVPPDAQAQVHEGFAAWLEGSGVRPGRLDVVLGSHLAAGLGAKEGAERGAAEARAVGLLVAAGERIAAAGDTLGAARLFARAAIVAPEEDPDRVGLLVRASDAASEAGTRPATADHHEIDAVLTEAGRAARTAGASAAEWRVRVHRAGLRLLAAVDVDELERARATAERTIEELSSLGDHAGLASAWMLRARVDRARGLWDASADAWELAADQAAEGGLPDLEARSLAELAEALVLAPVPIPEALERTRSALERLGGRRPDVQRAAGALAVLLARQGSLDEARERAVAAVGGLEELGLGSEVADATVRAAEVEALAGDPAAAEAHLRTGAIAADLGGDPSVAGRVAADLAHVLAEQGRAEEALELAAAADAGRLDVPAQVKLRLARARALAALGRLAEARAAAREAVRRADQTDSAELRGIALLDLAEVLRMTGRENESAPFARKAKRAFERHGSTVLAARAVATLHRLGGTAGPSAEDIPQEPASPTDERQERPTDATPGPEEAAGGEETSGEQAPEEEGSEGSTGPIGRASAPTGPEPTEPSSDQAPSPPPPQGGGDHPDRRFRWSRHSS